MRSSFSVVSVAALVLAGPVYAQQPAAERPCLAVAGLSVEYLHQLTAQYHPEALAPAAQGDSVLVGFVLDSSCTVVRHAVGRRVAGAEWVDSSLARLFPDLKGASYLKVGAAAFAAQAPGGPTAIWGVLKRS